MNVKKYRLSSIEDIDECIRDLKDPSNQYSGDKKKMIAKLLKLKEVSKNKDPISLLEFVLEDRKDRPFTRGGKRDREGLQDKLVKFKVEYLVAKYKDLMSPEGPIKKYASKEALKDRKEELRSKVLEITKKRDFDALENAYLELLIENEKANYRITANQKEIRFLYEKLEEKYLNGRMSAVKNQTQGIKIRNQKDTDCKKAGLGLLRKTLNRELIGSDFTHYVVVMEDKDLMQNNSKKLTSTKDGWDLATLRKYFADETRLTPTWSKKLASVIRNKYPKETRRQMIQN